MGQNRADVLERLARARTVLPRLSWQAEKGKLLSFYEDLTNHARPAARMVSA
jgi:hypothetical protein